MLLHFPSRVMAITLAACEVCVGTEYLQATRPDMYSTHCAVDASVTSDKKALLKFSLSFLDHYIAGATPVPIYLRSMKDYPESLWMRG